MDLQPKARRRNCYQIKIQGKFGTSEIFQKRGNLFKNRNFVQKNRNFGQKSKCCSKSICWSKIEILLKHRNLVEKSKLCSKIKNVQKFKKVIRENDLFEINKYGSFGFETSFIILHENSWFFFGGRIINSKRVSKKRMNFYAELNKYGQSKKGIEKRSNEKHYVQKEYEKDELGRNS